MSVRIRQRYVSPSFAQVQSQKNRLLKQLKMQAVTPHCLIILLFKIDNLINGSDGERLRNVLNELPGVTTSAINLDTKEVTINYYEGWIRFARKIIKTLEDNGFKAVVLRWILLLSKRKECLRLRRMTYAHIFEAYLEYVIQKDIENNEVKVSFYQGWTTKGKLIKTIEERGNTTVKQDLMALKTS